MQKILQLSAEGLDVGLLVHPNLEYIKTLESVGSGASEYQFDVSAVPCEDLFSFTLELNQRIKEIAPNVILDNQHQVSFVYDAELLSESDYIGLVFSEKFEVESDDPREDDVCTLCNRVLKCTYEQIELSEGLVCPIVQTWYNQLIVNDPMVNIFSGMNIVTNAIKGESLFREIVPQGEYSFQNSTVGVGVGSKCVQCGVPERVSVLHSIANEGDRYLSYYHPPLRIELCDGHKDYMVSNSGIGMVGPDGAEGGGAYIFPQIYIFSRKLFTSLITAGWKVEADCELIQVEVVV